MTAAHRGRARGFEMLHHVLAAATLSSAVLLLEHWHLLEWLDAGMLRVVAPAHVDPAGADLPQLVLIDASTYASRFSLRSPLERNQLTEIVNDVLAAHPATLVVDLQLEPAVGENGERPLDRLLQAAARDSARATRIVLPVPESRTPSLDRGAMTWMRAMCRAGVAFGSAGLRSHLGAVIRVEDDPSTLAGLVRTPVEAGSQGPSGASVGAPCGIAERGAELSVLRQMLAEAGPEPSRSEPLSPGALKRIIETRLAWEPGRTREALLMRLPRVVVLGGDYDERDRFLTNASDAPVAGAAVHAAAIASHGRIHALHGAGWAIDVAIGLLLGFIFTALWRQVGRISVRTGASLRRFLLVSWLRLAAAGVIWGVALGIAYALMRASGALWESGTWMNPGPVVLGMFLHALLLKDAPHARADSWASFTAHVPAWPLQAVTMLVTLAWLMAAQAD